MSASSTACEDRARFRQELTLEEARADRAARAQRHIASCVLVAVVTSPRISAELIDQAILCANTSPDAT